MNGGRHAATRSAVDVFMFLLIVVVSGLFTYGVGKAFRSAQANNDPTTTAAITDPATTDPTNIETTTTQPTTTTQSTTTTTEATTTTVAELLPRDPSEVRVMVFNGEGTKGLAGLVTDDLAAAGYQTVTPTDYGDLIDTSKVWYAEGFLTEAHQVAAFVPDADIERNTAVTADFEVDVVVVLGASYNR